MGRCRGALLKDEEAVPTPYDAVAPVTTPKRVATGATGKSPKSNKSN